jgi:hypothetical protein
MTDGWRYPLVLKFLSRINTLSLLKALFCRKSPFFKPEKSSAYTVKARKKVVRGSGIEYGFFWAFGLLFKNNHEYKLFQLLAAFYFPKPIEDYNG